jgi:ATP-dependent Clp protease protease subunit
MDSRSLGDRSTLNGDDEKNSKEKKNYGRAFIDEKLFKSRTLTIFGEVNDKLARNVTEHLLALAAETWSPVT